MLGRYSLHQAIPIPKTTLILYCKKNNNIKLKRVLVNFLNGIKHYEPKKILIRRIGTTNVGKEEANDSKVCLHCKLGIVVFLCVWGLRKAPHIHTFFESKGQT